VCGLIREASHKTFIWELLRGCSRNPIFTRKNLL